MRVETKHCLVCTTVAHLVCKSCVWTGRDLSIRYGGKSRLQTTRRDKALPCLYRNGTSWWQIVAVDRSQPVSTLRSQITGTNRVCKPRVEIGQCLVSTAMAYYVCKSCVGTGRDLSVRNGGNRGGNRSGGQVATCPYQNPILIFYALLLIVGKKGVSLHCEMRFAA